MNFTSQSAYAQYFDVRINYIYYEVIGRNEQIENLVHSIRYDKIMECLEEKGYSLHKEDIIYLLKDDGAHFFEDSLRLYDPGEEAYFKISEDWELAIDYNEPSLSLLLWIKSINPNFRRKFDEISEDMKNLNDKTTYQIESLEGRFESNRVDLYDEIKKLKLSTQILFQQLARVYNDQVPSLAKDVSLREQEEALQEPLKLGSEHSEKVQEEEAVAASVAINYDKLFSYHKQTASTSAEGIDIALMYSEPLVRRDEYGIISLGEPVDYEEECSKVIDILRKKEKKINVYFEIATVRHLVNVLSLSPKVLHIICHGDFNKARNEFFLCFEENGELSELYSKDLKVRLQEVNFCTQIVFINACHSEEVARVFMDAGVSCVVAVHSELKIEDSIAQKFSESFYWQLFEGKSISDSFRNAKAAISGKDVYTCCCAHSHKDNCKWYKLAKEEGFEKAHHIHTPTCTDCNSKFGNKFLHKENCMWALDFLTSVCEHDEFPHGDFHVCCCSPELPHDEVMKFKLICKDEKYSKEVLFPYKDKGELNIKSTHSCVEQKFSVMKMTGRNKETYEIFGFLTSKDKRMVNIYGLEGVGKTTLAKQVANYVYERGFFREKVCAMILEKVPSMTYFRSNLFKEIPGSCDMKSFCESINLGRMLFILVKCDKLIKDYFEQFRQDLAFIMEYAPNVKFLIITNNKVDLRLGECHVLIKELKKIDAATLLCKNAYLYLPWDQRNVYNLAQHGALDFVPLTPQGIWSLSEKLKDNKSLDEIETELTLEKENHDENHISTETNDTITKILKKIKDSNPDIYKLIIFLCLFPAGLSYRDLELIAKQGKIPGNWKEILLSFLRKKSLCNQFYHQLAGSGGENNAVETSDGDQSQEKKKIERSDFKPDNYIWISINKDPIDNEIWFAPTQFLVRYVEKHLCEDFYNSNIEKLEYMAMLSLHIIERVKKHYDYIEKLLEFSAVSTYGIWRVCDGHKFSGSVCDNFINPLENYEYDFERAKRWFGSHEGNFFNCLDPEIMKCMVSQNMSDQLIEVMEILCLTIPTLFKIMVPRESGAMEAARKAEQSLKCLGDDNPRIHILKVKINLFLVALYLGAKTDVAESFSLAKIQLKLTQEEQEKVKDHNKAKLLMSEIEFAKALYYHRGFKNNCLNVKDFPNKYSVHQEISVLLKSAEALLIPEIYSDTNFKVARAKIAMIQCKARNNRSGLEKKHLLDMKEALIAFTDYKSPRLLMKAHYLYASLKLEIERKKMGVRQAEISMENSREIIKRLVAIKNGHLVRVALEIAKKIKYRIYEAKIKRKIDEINMEIRHRFFNVIIILRAAPIVDVGNDEQLFESHMHHRHHSDDEIHPIAFPTRLASSFKNNLMDSLNACNKVLCMKFGILTRKELIDSLLSGCRVLQLNCVYSEKNYLCVEGPYGAVDRISFEDVQSIFSPKNLFGNSPRNTIDNLLTSTFAKLSSLAENLAENNQTEKNGSNNEIQEAAGSEIQQRQPNFSRASILSRKSTAFCQAENKLLDVLILCVKNNRELADLFISLKIPHIITFEFLGYEENFWQKTCQDQCIELFTIYFYEELVVPRTISEAFEIAYDKVFEHLGEKFFDGKPKSHVLNVIGRGPILLPEDADHNEALFSPNKFPLSNGPIDDISSTIYPSNIEKISAPLTGRKKEMYTVIQKIGEDRGFLEVTGAPGVGKTTFILHAGYNILNRHHFSDGVHYVPLKNLKYGKDPDFQVKDLLWEALGLNVQNGFANFFKGKSMLIIFDDFDVLYDIDVEYPRLFLLTLKECKIPCIMVTTKRSDDSTKGQECDFSNSIEESSARRKEIEEELLDSNARIELPSLNEEELALILQSLTKGNEKNIVKLDELRDCRQIKEANGSPQYIIESLFEQKIEVNGRTLEMCPSFYSSLDFESHYVYNNDIEYEMSPTNFRKAFSTQPELSKMISVLEPSSSQPGLQNSRKGSFLNSHQNIDDIYELYKSKSSYFENKDLADLPFIKAMSGGLKPPNQLEAIRWAGKENRYKKKSYESYSSMMNQKMISAENLPDSKMKKTRSHKISGDTLDCSHVSLSDLEIDMVRRENTKKRMEYLKDHFNGNSLPSLVLEQENLSHKISDRTKDDLPALHHKLSGRTIDDEIGKLHIDLTERNGDEGFETMETIDSDVDGSINLAEEEDDNNDSLIDLEKENTSMRRNRIFRRPSRVKRQSKIIRRRFVPRSRIFPKRVAQDI